MTTTNSFHKKKDTGLFVVVGLFLFAIILGVLVFNNYVRSEKVVTQALTQLKIEAPSYGIEECAQHTMNWYLSCNVMQQICDDTVPRMMKICLVLGHKVDQCSVYGKSIYGYNFGAKECQPYFKDRRHKKACADVRQTIADFCKLAQKE